MGLLCDLGLHNWETIILRDTGTRECSIRRCLSCGRCEERTIIDNTIIADIRNRPISYREFERMKHEYLCEEE